MQIINVNAKGLECPKPILAVRSALKEADSNSPIAVYLDNETSALNVAAFLETLDYSTQMYNENNDFLVLAIKDSPKDMLVWHESSGWKVKCDGELEENISSYSIAEVLRETPQAPVKAKESVEKIISPPKTVLLVPSRFMGQGDDELGARLALTFFDTLSSLDSTPDMVALYNGGVFLACENSSCLDALKDFESQGATIISCGTCLDFYNLKNKLKVGRVGNMYEIVQSQMNADKVIRM